ncbi:hypothetical protein [Salmonella enterica]
MSNLNNEDFNAIKEAGFINEWKKPGSDELITAGLFPFINKASFLYCVEIFII